MSSRNHFFLGLALFALGACGTTAEGAWTQMTERQSAAYAEARRCTAAAAEVPRFQPLAARMPLAAPARPSLAMLAEQALPTPAELDLLREWHAEVLPCRESWRRGDLIAGGGMPSTREAAFDALDALYAEMLGGRVTWSSFNRRLVETRNAANQRLERAMAERTAEFRRAHQAELDRQATAAAVMAAAGRDLQAQARAQQQQVQQQQLLWELSRPRQTNCVRLGFNLSCTTN